MQLFTPEQQEKLVANGVVNRERRAAGLPREDFPPVVKLFTPDDCATWLLTEIDPDRPDSLFGLCDDGHGAPKVASVSLEDLTEIRGWTYLPIERDRKFKADKPLSAYAEEARRLGRIPA